MTSVSKMAGALLGGLMLGVCVAGDAEAALHTELNASTFFGGGANPEPVGPGTDEISGFINGSDNGDLYKLVFDAGGAITIRGRGTTGLLNPILFLFDAAGGGIIADHGPSPTSTAIINTTIAAGTYYLGIGDDPLRAIDTDGSIWEGAGANNTPPPADFGVLSRLENTGTIIGPGNYRITLSLPTAGGTQVPEPAALGLLALGLVAFRRRRRRV